MRMLFSVACFMLVLCGSSVLHGQQNRSAGSQSDPPFRSLTKNDPKSQDPNYAGVVGYFPDTVVAEGVGSNCHNFLAEMGLDVPGASILGCGFVPGDGRKVDYPSCGDVAEVYGRELDGKLYHLHSAIYLGYGGFYLQRNGNSDIQISSQNYIDRFAPNGLVRYLEPKKPYSSKFADKLASLGAKIPDSKEYFSIRLAFKEAKYACFPNQTPKPKPGITQNPPPSGDFGKVCPPTTMPRQAAAAGCRWVGGYDICANPGTEHLPQCAIVNQPSPSGRPSDYRRGVRQ